MVDEDKNITTDAEQDFAEADLRAAGPETPRDNRKRNLGAWLGYGALLLMVLLVVAGVFLLRELRSKQEDLGTGQKMGGQQMQELLHQISSLQGEVTTIHQQLASVQSQVTTEDSKFEREIGEEVAAFNQKIEAVRAELSGSIQLIQRHLNQTRGDVMLADAEYLLSVANQKLHLVGDVKAVIAMMEAADQRLHDSGDPAVFKVREALASEINQLKEFDAPDIVGISAKLLALEAKVKDLPLFLPHAERSKEDHQPAAESVKDEAAKKDAGWAESLGSDLKSLVTVRHTDRPVQAILVPEEVAALRQVLLLKLEMIRSALLRGDEDLFRTNLDSALSWLQENFDADAALTASVADDLKSFRTLKFQVPFPDIGKSLGLLRNIEKLRLDVEKTQGTGEGKPAQPEKAPETPAEPAPEFHGPPAPPELQPLPEAKPLPEEGGNP